MERVYRKRSISYLCLNPINYNHNYISEKIKLTGLTQKFMFHVPVFTCFNDLGKMIHKIQDYVHRLLDSLVVECWLRVPEVPGSIPSQGPRHTKDVIKMVPVVPWLSTQHLKGKYCLFLKH